MSGRNPNHFPTTAWTLVNNLTTKRGGDRVGVLNVLLTRYWKPVFYFLRCHGKDLHAAEDLTQEFFLELLERDSLAVAKRERGRFRTFLLTLLARFLSDRSPIRGRNRTSLRRGSSQFRLS